MKKAISYGFLLLFLTTLLLQDITPTKAKGSKPENIIKVTIINQETKEKIELPVSEPIYYLSNSEKVVEQNVLIPTSVLSNESAESKWDKNYSVYGTFKQFYSESGIYTSVDRY